MTTASETPAAAADWLIRLEGDASTQAWDEFQQWLDASPRHRAAFIRLRAAWTRCDRLKMLRPADGTIDSDLLVHLDVAPAETPEGDEIGGAERTDPDFADLDGCRPMKNGMRVRGERNTSADRRRWLAAAAVIVAAGILGWLGTFPVGWRSYETPVGGRQQIVLADGSMVQLNTDSKLRVRILETRRDLVLLRGEALFQVAHDRMRPFYVSAGGTVVRAVGTAFSVRIRDSERVEVLVTEGRIAVGAPANPDHPVLPTSASAVVAGEAATVKAGALSVRPLPLENVQRKLAWTSGRLAFRGETLTEAVQEFNRYSRRRLTIADPSIEQLQVGGNFQAADPESFVAALERSFGVRALAAPGDNQEIRLSAGGQESREPSMHNKSMQ